MPSGYHDLAKWLSHYLYFFSYLDLLYKKESVGKCHIIISYISHISGYHRVTLHDKCGKVVHRPCSSCISSIQNLIETLSSSPCQLRLRIALRYLSLSFYTGLTPDTQACRISQQHIYWLIGRIILVFIYRQTS